MSKLNWGKKAFCKHTDMECEQKHCPSFDEEKNFNLRAEFKVPK